MSKPVEKLKKMVSAQRMTSRIVLGVFILLVISALVAFGLVAIIEQYYPLDEDGSLLVFALIVLAISIVIGTGLSVLFSRILVKNTAPYVDALQRVSECDFSVQVKELPFFENLHIAKNFNNMVSQLKSVETLRESFVSDFSHEFKTPIVSIQGFATLLKDENLTVEQRNEYLDVILSESKRLVDLSQNVLTLTRLDSQQVVWEKYRLDEQLRHCMLLFDKACSDKQIELELNCPPMMIVGCEKLYSQVWVNLISNAVKFSPCGSKIAVEVTEGKKQIAVSVADSGCGMSEDVKKNIFNKFYQGDSSRTTEGNGLGLSIVKKVLALTGGSIVVESKQGTGSTFTVYLSKDRKI